MLSGLLVFLLVELAHRLLNYRAHAVVVRHGVLDRALAIQDWFGTRVYSRSFGFIYKAYFVP